MAAFNCLQHRPVSIQNPKTKTPSPETKRFLMCSRLLLNLKLQPAWLRESDSFDSTTPATSS